MYSEQIESRRILEPIPGYAPHVGMLVASLEYCRVKTLSRVDDDWLWNECVLKRGIVTNYYWQWYHVFEDEMSHRGEINWLMSRIPDAHP